MATRSVEFSYFFSIKKLFSAANLWLIVLSSTVISYSFFSLNTVNQSLKQQKQTLIVQVLQEQGYNFGYNYIVSAQGLEYLANYASPLSVGNYYGVEANTTLFGNDSVSNRDKNLLYKGLEGKLSIRTANKSSNCDVSCWIIQQRQSVKQLFSRHFSRDVCQSTIVQLLISLKECGDISALAFGFLLGGSTNLSKETYQSFSYFSLTHLIAVSGFQVVILMSALEGVLTSISISRKMRFLIILFAVALFTWLVGFEIPVVRSGLSIVLSQLVLIAFGRKLGGLRALLYSAIILCLVNPLVLFSLSFQLSCLATFGIVVGKNDMITRLLPQTRSTSLIEAVRIYGIIFILILPIISQLSGKVNPVSIGMNLLILPSIPLICLLLCCGFIPVIGELFSLLAYVCIQGIIQFLAWFKTVNPIPDFSIVSLDTVSIISYYGIVLTSLSAYLLVRRLNYVTALEKSTG